MLPMLLAACSTDLVAPTEEPLAAICARVDAAVARLDAYFHPDAQLEAVARVVPGGFGGYFIASPGGNTIYLLHPDSLEAARRTAGRAEACASRPRLPALAFVSSAVAARQGRFDYIQLVEWYARLGGALDASLRVVFSDIDESENRLRFGFADADAQRRFQEQVMRLGIPVQAVEVVVQPYPVRLP